MFFTRILRKRRPSPGVSPVAWVIGAPLATVLLAPPAHAQCPVIDFNDLAVNTAVTNQYDGVVFSAPASLGACAVGACRIQVPANGTASPTKALCVDSIAEPSCEFHPQYMRMVFADLQRYVSFVVGPGNTEEFQDYQVRAYNVASGGAPHLPVITVTNAGNGVFRFVEVVSANADIKRIEVQGMNGTSSAGIECIDDLLFGLDTTPPIASISAPLFPNCGCANVPIQGEACDPDGEYGFDKADYRLAGAAPNVPWNPIGQFNSPLCGGGLLYNWNTAAVAEGLYEVRLVVENACGLTSEARTLVYVGKDFDEVLLRSPVNAGVYGGKVCIEGSANDEYCFSSYTVDFKPAVGGAYMPVDPAKPVYNSAVRLEPLATWQTVSGNPPDGAYQVRLRGATICGQTAETIRNVSIDNSPAVAQITSPIPCDYVGGIVQIWGTASDAHLTGYSLQYIGGGVDQWAEFDNGNAPVVNGLLGEWNTAGLPKCAYAIRLVVNTNVILDCDDPQQSVDHVVVILGCEGDINFDKKIDQADLGVLLGNFGVNCP